MEDVSIRVQYAISIDRGKNVNLSDPARVHPTIVLLLGQLNVRQECWYGAMYTFSIVAELMSSRDETFSDACGHQ